MNTELVISADKMYKTPQLGENSPLVEKSQTKRMSHAEKGCDYNETMSEKVVTS